jgi:hypothetical protein
MNLKPGARAKQKLSEVTSVCSKERQSRKTTGIVEVLNLLIEIQGPGLGPVLTFFLSESLGLGLSLPTRRRNPSQQRKI